MLTFFILKYPKKEPIIEGIKFLTEETIEIPNGKFPIIMILEDRKLKVNIEILNIILSIKFIFLFKYPILRMLSPSSNIKRN